MCAVSQRRSLRFTCSSQLKGFLKGSLCCGCCAVVLIRAHLQVAFYNSPGLHQLGGQSYKHALRVAQKLFPKGQAVAIIEPYYKVASDGTLLVRVDNPAEVRP